MAYCHLALQYYLWSYNPKLFFDNLSLPAVAWCTILSKSMIDILGCKERRKVWTETIRHRNRITNSIFYLTSKLPLCYEYFLVLLDVAVDF